MNQLATPGLGSLMARRYLAGTGQLLLALLGFGLIVAWFICLMIQIVHQADDQGGSAPSVAWLGELGAAVFAVSWVWALVTSLSLLRDAKASEPPTIDPARNA
jgi:drug/metabolite transporter (DMT)-like permease